MKKLMIAVAIVCAAAMSHAASVAWANTSASKVVGLDGSTAIKAADGVTFMLMQVGAGADGADKMVQSTTTMSMTAGVFSGANWTYTFGDDAKKGDEFYIIATMTSGGTDYEMVIDNAGANWAIAATDNGGSDTFTWAAGTYGGLAETATVGKWSVAAVPEPTSGLLLLLGMAGLALKRKRA